MSERMNGWEYMGQGDEWKDEWLGMVGEKERIMGNILGRGMSGRMNGR